MTFLVKGNVSGVTSLFILEVGVILRIYGISHNSKTLGFANQILLTVLYDVESDPTKFAIVLFAADGCFQYSIF